jgi:hypothetical protein
MTKTSTEAEVLSTSQPNRMAIALALINEIRTFHGLDVIDWDFPALSTPNKNRALRQADAIIATFSPLEAALAATPAVGGEAVNDTVRKIVYQMSPVDQYDLAFKVAENVGYILVREAEHPDSPHLSDQPATPAVGGEVLPRIIGTFGLSHDLRAVRALFAEPLTIEQHAEILKRLTAQPASPLRGSVCCYCDAPLSCARCGVEQPDDTASPLRGRDELIDQCALIAEEFDAAYDSPRMKLFVDAGLVMAIYKRDGEIGAAIRALSDKETQV